MCKRWHQLVHSPWLLRELRLECVPTDLSEEAELALAWARLRHHNVDPHGLQPAEARPSVLPRLRSLCEWLAKHAPGHVQHCSLHIVAEQHYVHEWQHLEATEQCVQLISDCMAALAAGGSLRSLELSLENLQLDCAPWAGLMSGLQRLHIGCSGCELELGSWVGGMQSLKQLSVAARSLSITGALPPSLTRVVLHGREMDGLPDGVRYCRRWYGWGDALLGFASSCAMHCGGGWARYHSAT